jgi:hypothetical protein
MNLTLIAAFVRALAGAATIVDSGKKAQAIASAANYGATLIEKGVEAEEKLQALRVEIEGFVAAPETLTDESFDRLKERSDAAHDVIQNS